MEKSTAPDLNSSPSHNSTRGNSNYSNINGDPPSVLSMAPEASGLRNVVIIACAVVVFLIFLGGSYFLITQTGRTLERRIKKAAEFKKSVRDIDIKDPGIRKINFKDIEGRFIKADSLGAIFIIKGTVINGFSESRRSILLQGTILDNDQKVIRQKLVYAGNVFSDDELNEMSLEEINTAFKNRNGVGNINTDVLPEGSIPFMIVFENLPDNLEEFYVEAIKSSPGVKTKQP